MSFEVVQHGVPLSGITRRFAGLPAKARVEVLRGLSEGGLRIRTMVRRSLREQMNVKTMRAVHKRTSSYLNSPNLSYHIKAIHTGIPISEFKTRVTKRGVWSDPWNNGRVFARSFRNRRSGKLQARRGRSRMPVRSLYGPNIGKELVKDDTLKTFEDAGRAVILPIITRRLVKLGGF